MTRAALYQPILPLSRGGMAQTWLARTPNGRMVVIKKALLRDPDSVARLRDEARLGLRLFHPHLVETLDSYEEDGMPVLVLGFIEGATCEILRRHVGTLEPASVARIGCHVADALAAIHEALDEAGQPLRAVHRDVSPENIIVTPQGDAVLIDLGIARTDELRAARTAVGVMLGTMRVMAPELVDGAQATAAADVYSLGCVLIELATGRPTFEGAPSEVAAAIVGRGPLSSEAVRAIEPRLLAVIERMVARRPEDRFAAAHEASAALRTLEESLGGGKGVGDASAKAVARESEARGAAEAAAAAEILLPPTPRVETPVNVPDPLRMDQPLELAVQPPRRSTRLDPGPADPRDWYPAIKRDHSWFRALLKRVAILLVVAAAGAWIWSQFMQDERARARAELEERARRDEALLRDALGDAPSCHVPGAVMWVYDDDKGTAVIVDSLQKVPPRFRRMAECVATTR